MSDWYAFENGESLGTTGSEAGTIIVDEEHPAGARITIERGGHTRYSITCGVYDVMVHTRFFSSEPEAREQCQLMKPALAEIASMPSETSIEKLGELCENFVNRFPT